MGFLDELKRLTHPYEDEMEDDYDEDEDVYEDEEEPEDVEPTPPPRPDSGAGLLPQRRSGYRPWDGKPHCEHQHHHPAAGGPGEAGTL